MLKRQCLEEVQDVGLAMSTKVQQVKSSQIEGHAEIVLELNDRNTNREKHSWKTNHPAGEQSWKTNHPAGRNM